VLQLGERHFVVDGHHRVSVARSLGMSAIDAEVTLLGASPRAC
jgi:ParB-like chromosome segregation protein Spo0J